MTALIITGIVSPVRMGASGDWETANGADIIRSDVGDLLGTLCATADEDGEVPWDGDRGSQLPGLRHRNVHPEMTRALAEQLAIGTLQVYEHRIMPTRVEVEMDQRTGRLQVNVGYVTRTVAGGQNVQTATVLGG